jgi:hypothetical protein
MTLIMAESNSMRPLTLALAVLFSAATPAATQRAVDTTLAVQGFLQQDDEFGICRRRSRRRRASTTTVSPH